jgi:hypothetical protein
MPSDYVELVHGRCWWCGAPADSREHRLKKSDLVREFGKPPFTGLRTLTRVSGDDRHEFRGPDSGLVKFQPSICMRCNNTRSQPFDVAWDSFVGYLAKQEVEVLRDCSLDLEAIFGTDWAARAADVERYVVKHLICRVAEQRAGPIQLHRKLLDFLDGGAYPGMLRLDLCIDLGVAEMLRVARAASPPEQPEAADGGFMGLTPLWVQQSQSTGKCTEPQAGLYYRWLGVFWIVAHGPFESVFAQQVVPLDTSDDFFGPEFRELLRRGAVAEDA